jgi:hypothetical protein
MLITAVGRSWLVALLSDHIAAVARPVRIAKVELSRTCVVAFGRNRAWRNDVRQIMAASRGEPFTGHRGVRTKLATTKRALRNTSNAMSVAKCCFTGTGGKNSAAGKDWPYLHDIRGSSAIEPSGRYSRRHAA